MRVQEGINFRTYSICFVVPEVVPTILHFGDIASSSTHIGEKRLVFVCKKIHEVSYM